MGIAARVVPVVVLLGAVPTHTGDAPAPQAPPEQLAPLARLVGTEWVADFPGGGMTDTQSFEWMLGGKFLRNVHHVSDAAGTVVYRGETVYAWDPRAGAILWWYFNTTGGYLTGEAEIDGTSVAISGVNHAGDDQTAKVKGTMEIDDGSWESTSYFWVEGQWKKRFTLRFLPAAGSEDAGDDTRVLRKEVLVRAPLDAVWRAWTTADGLRFVSAKSRVELEIGGAYEWFLDLEPDEQGRRGGEGARILAFLPREMLAFTWTFPPTVPGLRKAGETTQVVVTFEEGAEGSTRVRFAQHGWREGEAWEAGYAYFDRAWTHVLERLKAVLEEKR